jgi:hypothetical protein
LILKFHRAGPDAWSASHREGGGYTCADAWIAATSDVATTRPANTPQGMPIRLITLSSAVSNQVRIGFGATGQMNTSMGPLSHPRNIIPSTNPCLDQPARSRPTGKTSWWGRSAPSAGLGWVLERMARRAPSSTASPTVGATPGCRDPGPLRLGSGARAQGAPSRPHQSLTPRRSPVPY